MKRVLLEPSFPPRQAALLSSTDLSFERFSEDAGSDVDLVRHASQRSFRAIVFLGRQTLGRTDVVEEARTLGIALLATETFDPLDAIVYIRENRSKLSSHLVPGARVLVLSNEVRTV